MKPLLLILGTITLALTMLAQTESTRPATAAETDQTPATEPAEPQATAPTPTMPTPPETEITSDSAKVYYNKTNTVVVYHGNVRVSDPQMKLTCGILTAHLTQSNKVDTIVAETNVVVNAVQKDNKPINATCAKAVYSYRIVNGATNETLLLSGDSVIRYSDGSSVVSDPILFDLVTGEIEATNRTTTRILIPHDMKGHLRGAPSEAEATAETNTPAKPESAP